MKFFRFLKFLVYCIVILVAGVALVALFLPDRVHVERTQIIAAPPEKVFDVLNGYSEFNQWSPWYAKDPGAEYRTEGPETGVGATFYWHSESQDVGSGSQKIIASEPPGHLKVALSFEGQGDAIAAFDIVPVDDGSSVTWSLDAEFGFDLIGRWMGYLLFDRWVGRDYAAGLSNLADYVENEKP